MQYNEAEKSVLSHFFTNLDSNVYCATDAMPTQLWALLLGGYSRSDLSLRDRLLKVFKDIHKNNYYSFIEEYAKVIDASDSTYISDVMSVASEFMAKWAVDYGHNSLKDSSCDRIAIENVSIRATKILEDSSLGAFQEKSTRYMDFSVNNYYIPESEFINDEHRQILSESMDLYREVLAAAIEHFKTIIDRNDFKSEAAWIRTCKAKAFDEARYVLPTATRTSLGVTMPTRETERWIAKMLAAPEKEIRDLAIQIKNECILVNPGLITRVKENEYLNLNSTQNAIDLFSIANKVEATGKIDDFVAVTQSKEPEFLILAQFCASVGIFDMSKAAVIEDEEWIAALENTLNARGPHDEMPKWTSCSEMSFRFTIDIGAYRDVQRHRVGTQLTSDWCPDFGYSIPDYLETEGASELKTKYIAHCEKIADVIGKLYKADRFNAAYFLILGTNINVIYTCNFKQAVYFIELRSGASGHYSYRRLAHKMYEFMQEEYPMFAKFIRVDLSGYSDRRAAEERIQEKISKLENN